MKPHNVLALDVGGRRVGIAVASNIARLPQPLLTLDRTKVDVFESVKELIDQNDVKLLVVGLPRDMNGQETAQTTEVRNFADQLTDKLNMEVEFQDEAVTSIMAEEQLIAKGKPYSKEDIDMLAACQILEDWLKEN
jgi:putative holliday junction resolvase